MMDAMLERASGSGMRGRSRRVLLPVALVGVLTISGCSGADVEPSAFALPISEVATAPSSLPAEIVSTTTVAPAPTTVPTVPPTTSPAPASTMATASTTTTIVVRAPVDEQPIAPPADEYAQEPVIETGSIAIPKLGVDMTMYEGIRLTTLDKGPGHWPGSALPGETGNVVVGGHRTSSHRVFRDVDQLVAGDEIVFRDETGEHTYLVNRVEIVEPTAIWIVDPTDTPTATLFACHPPGSTKQRIVVFADLAVPPDA